MKPGDLVVILEPELLGSNVSGQTFGVLLEMIEKDSLSDRDNTWIVLVEGRRWKILQQEFELADCKDPVFCV